MVKPGSAQPIASLIPADEVRRALAGRVGALDLTLRSIEPGSALVEVNAQIVDPKGMVDAVRVRVAPGVAGTIVPYSEGSWPPVGDTESTELKRDSNSATASGRVQITLSGRGPETRKVLVQTARRYRSGQLVYSKPEPFDLPERPGRIYSPGTSFKAILKAAGESIALLESCVDPDKDCRLIKDAQNDSIKIEVPANKLHTLAPEVVAQLDKKKPLHNAPMTLTDVEGDFVAVVLVTGEISPGLALPDDRQGNHIPATFQGAGLLLYLDRDNFVRLERTSGVAAGSMRPIERILFEVVRGGKQVVSQNDPLPPNGPAYLFLMRRNRHVSWGRATIALHFPCQTRESSLTFHPRSRLDFRPPTSQPPFTAIFENFAVLSDAAIINAKFGDPDEVGQ